MSKLPIRGADGRPSGEYEIADSLLVFDKGAQAVKDAVVRYQANHRQGSASTKNKGEVAGSNRKLWAQKGTGRARTGLRQSPIWRGGGVAFGPRPRSFAKDMPKQVVRLAFRRALSDKVASGSVSVIGALDLGEPKTKSFVSQLRALGGTGPTLIITDKVSANLRLASRNVPLVEVVNAATVNTYQLVRYPVILVTEAGMKALELRLQGGEGE